MKLTVRRSLAIASVLLFFLLVAFGGLILLPVDRRVSIPGQFVYTATAPVVARVDGFLDAVHVARDEIVAQGQLLAVLSNPELISELESSRAALAIIDLELAQILRTGGYDADSGRLDLSRMRKDLDYREDRLIYLDQARDSARTLADRNLGSRRSFEEAELAFKEETARVAELRIELAMAEQQLRQLDDAARVDYELKEREREITQARLRLLEQQEAALSLRSPRAGRFVSDGLERRIGVSVRTGDHIGEVVSDRIAFEGIAGPVDVVRLDVDQRVFFNVELFRRKQIVEGRVTRVGPQATESSGFPVEIEVPDRRFFDRGRELSLRSGMEAEAVILTEEGIPLGRILWERVVDAVDPY